MNPSRRHFLHDCAFGLGPMALASLLSSPQGLTASQALPTRDPLAPRSPHAKGRVKQIIHLFMAGAPSQLDLFDPKPTLAKFEGKPIPPEIVRDQRYAFIRPDSTLLGPRFPFARHGQSGATLSSVLPHLARVVDRLTIIRSMHTDQFNHAPAQLLLSTGSPLPGRPCIGSWVTYGLGSEASDLPAYVVLSSAGGLSGGSALYSSGFLPTVYAGVPFRTRGEPVVNVASPAGIDPTVQRATLDAVGRWNRRRLDHLGDPEIATRINAYEMAFRLQTSAPELIDLKRESAATLRLYGAEPGKPSFAMNCLLARRLVERGVRFVTLFHEGWDHHSDVSGGLKTQCGNTDRACAALLLDLEQRGLLDETLVVWGGEFGRTPMVEASASLGRANGRDHHPQAFTIWLAGGGIQRGLTVGATDELGFHIVEDPIHVHDLQATMLHLLGFDHERLTFTFQGRAYRLTDVHGKIVEKILA